VREPPARADSTALNATAPADESAKTSTETVPTETAGSAASSRWPQQSTLERQALAVSVYTVSAPSNCGLASPRSESGATTATVYFGCSPRQGPLVPAVPARIVRVESGSDPMRVALRALFAGPTDPESRAGYISSFSAASAKIPFRVARLANGLAVVDFDRAILDVNAPRPDPTQNPRHLFVATMDAHQIVATLSQFPGVRRVAILICGEPWCRVRGEC
jgi:spore germination protein GerM